MNELAEMKNCNKCLLFEGRKNRPDLYLWAANIARGPSAKVSDVHLFTKLDMLLDILVMLVSYIGIFLYCSLKRYVLIAHSSWWRTYTRRGS